MQQDSNPISEWGTAQKIAFRFVFVYLVLYNLPFPFAIPSTSFPFTWLNEIGAKYGNLLGMIVPWVGKNILQIEGVVQNTPTGSGDRLFDYILTGTFLVLAFLIGIIWTGFARKRANYEYLHQCLCVYVRFSLANSMIGYGAYKVIKSQFPNPFLNKLVQPFGEASPMGLVWTFMGFSEPYNIFTGSAEMLGGILLVSPRLTTLGALVCIGVMSNVFMLNMSYDIPVKLYSGNLLLMSFFLLSPDLKRLARLFIFNRSVESVDYKPLFRNSRLNVASKLLAVTFIIFITVISLMESQDNKIYYENLRKQTALYGIWIVDEFEVEGEIKPPLLTDETRWRRVIFQFPTSMAIQRMNEKSKIYDTLVNTVDKTIDIKGEDQKGKFSYERPNAETLSFQGKLNDKETKIKFHRLDEKSFLINNRGFNWINENPYNR